MTALRTRDLARVAARLTLLQSAWCEGALQSAGLAYCLAPGLERIHGGEKALDEALRRHAEPFNTHPFMVGVVAGAVLRMEEDGVPSKRAAAFSRSAMGPLAAAGDPFFWGALAPASAVIASLAAILWGAAAGIAALLVSFNAVHLAVRFGGVVTGYRHGPEAPVRAVRWISAVRIDILKGLAAIGAGALVVLAALTWGGTLAGIAAPIAGICALALAFVLERRTAASLYAAPLAAIALIALGVAL